MVKCKYVKNSCRRGCENLHRINQFNHTIYLNEQEYLEVTVAYGWVGFHVISVIILV
jgi:hypothetical protein